MSIPSVTQRYPGETAPLCWNSSPPGGWFIPAVTRSGVSRLTLVASPFFCFVVRLLFCWCCLVLRLRLSGSVVEVRSATLRGAGTNDFPSCLCRVSDKKGDIQNDPRNCPCNGRYNGILSGRLRNTAPVVGGEGYPRVHYRVYVGNTREWPYALFNIGLEVYLVAPLSKELHSGRACISGNRTKHGFIPF